MLDGGFGRFCHLAIQPRIVSTRMEANVIPPWNVAVSALIRKSQRSYSSRTPVAYIPTRLPNRIRRNAEASPLSIHDVDSDVSRGLLPPKGRKT